MQALEEPAEADHPKGLSSLIPAATDLTRLGDSGNDAVNLRWQRARSCLVPALPPLAVLIVKGKSRYAKSVFFCGLATMYHWSTFGSCMLQLVLLHAMHFLCIMADPTVDSLSLCCHNCCYFMAATWCPYVLPQLSKDEGRNGAPF